MCRVTEGVVCMPEEKEESLTLDKRTIDVLVANIIPTSRYFEARFNHMEERINGLKDDLKDFRGDVDKRFEGVDKRFEQVDKRFEQVIASIDRLADTLDYRDEKLRGFTLRMFTIAITIPRKVINGDFLGESWASRARREGAE